MSSVGTVLAMVDALRAEVSALRAEVNTVRLAVWLYDGSSTRAFFTSHTLSAKEVLDVVEAGRRFEDRLGGAWEFHVATVATAFERWREESPVDPADLPAELAHIEHEDEEELVEFFSYGGDAVHCMMIETWELVEGLGRLTEADLVPPESATAEVGRAKESE